MTSTTSGDLPGDHPTLPLRQIPGSYGIPFFSPIKDRLDFFYTQGQLQFFQSRIAKYNSTVFRVNMPPGPFISSDPRVVALLDAASFSALYDLSKVDKTDVLTGTYVPSLSLTGGHRVCAYLDPSEPNHATLKQLFFTIIASRKSAFVPTFVTSYTSLLDQLETQLEGSDKKAVVFNNLNQVVAFEYVCKALFDASPAETTLGESGPVRSLKWLLFQLHPITTIGLPRVIEDPLLHSFPLPPMFVKSDYKALYAFFESAAAAALDEAESLGLSREEACHNLLFLAIFNAYGGMKVFFPNLMKWVLRAGPELHAKLAKEIRSVVAAENGKVTAAGLEKMELTKSVVWEALRMDPPVPYQYARAKEDMMVESHDARFEVKKGEMLFGFQPLATRDERVFEKGGEFVGERFATEEGRRLLKYVVWSNGPETVATAVGNKQCAGKEVVVMVGRLLVVVWFLRYDTFGGEVKEAAVESQVTITAVTKKKGEVVGE